ncbi:2-oxo acid dehydrogenase subunit E2 [Sinomonas atrocyanea]|uniref:2-oxo acid dehydrogenase subunit E2 n=1 Tax=Sinomonas atrocyanea TaxID=37927 RepID=UPI00277EB1C0|nr:2-oxo acid dehydrogenase subunit E2 [Sinomonas atrocyanea]MDQ0261739.1 pyruvate dehydrogenase E2 component (dihydrolipoamide acetyltransferase) [Sinomonas atrocyanea]MDR6623437.1 pyruvate dehydrogenase E2 component (dihydrolipoamide acetyltransferase) [Sinomonas atrocyanea]
MTTEQREDSVTTPLKGIRRTAARRMTAAWGAPAFHLSTSADMGAALSVKERAPGATVTDAILAACAAALLEHPAINAHYADEAVTAFGQVNLGLAVDTPAGLMVPVVKDAARLDLTGIAEARRDLAQRARQGSLTMADVSDGTFTVSNLGMLGIDYFDAILNVPQVAILAIGTTREEQVRDRDGTISWRPRARITLTCDHRAVDGATGARFLTAVKDRLETA